MTHDLEPFARLVMQKLGRNPDDWRGPMIGGWDELPALRAFR